MLGHGMSAQTHHGNVPRRRVGLEPSRRLVAIHDGHLHVHQNQRGRFGAHLLAGVNAVDGDRHLITFANQTPREHVAVIFVIFHEQQLWHISHSLLQAMPTASAHSWVVWASWRDCCLYGIPLLEFVCVSLLVV